MMGRESRSPGILKCRLAFCLKNDATFHLLATGLPPDTTEYFVGLCRVSNYALIVN